MYTLTSGLDVNNIVTSVFQKKPEKHPVGRSHKAQKDKPQKSVLIDVSQNMIEHDTTQFADLFDKYHHING